VNKKVYNHMAYVMFKGEKWVFLGMFFKKNHGGSFTGCKLAVLMSDPADVNSSDIDANSDFVQNATMRLVRLGDCTAVFEKVSGEVAFVEASAHRHLCYMMMDKVDLSPRKSNMNLDVKLLSLPPPAAGGVAAGAATSPTAPSAAQPPGVDSGSLRQSIRQRGAAVIKKTPAAKDVPRQTSAAKGARQKRAPSKAAVLKAASKAAPKKAVQQTAGERSAKGGGRRQPRGGKGKFPAQASPLPVDEDTHFDEVPQDSTAAHALGLLARGGGSVRPLSPPVVETPRIDEQGLLAKQMVDMSKLLSDMPAMIQSAIEANNAQQARSLVPEPQGKKRGPPEATPPRSPPNRYQSPRFQHPESDFSAAVVSPNTERLQALASVEDRYNDRVRSLGRQPGELNGSSRRLAIAPYAREQMFGGSVADAEPDARERANNDMENRGYRHLPSYTATRRPSNDPVPTVVNNYHYHGDSGYPRPSQGPLALQASGQPRGRFSFSGQGQNFPRQMQNAVDDPYYDEAHHHYNR